MPSIMISLKFAPLMIILSMCCSCVVTPRSVESLDQKCGRVSKRYVLDVHEIEAFPVHCVSHHCEAEAMLLVGVSVLGAIVSGSVMVVGNTVHWLEDQKSCPEQDFSSDLSAKGVSLLRDDVDKKSTSSSYRSSILTPTSTAAPTVTP